MTQRALTHYRFGLRFARLKRKFSKRSKYINNARNLYLKMGLENKPCSLCDSQNFSLLTEGDRYGFDLKKQICNQCGLVQTRPALSEQFHQEFYTHHYRPLYMGGVVEVDYDGLIEDQANKGIALLAYLSKHLAPHLKVNQSIKDLAVIEIGCSSGGILKNIQPHVRSVQGCDLDYKAIEYAKKTFNLNVEVSTYPTELPEGRRLFVLSHVLEHLYDPLTTFHTIHDLMEEGDFLYVSVPGLNSVADGDYKHDLRRYFHIAHVTDFTATTLSAMASAAAFITLDANEAVDGLFKPAFNGAIEWQRSAEDSVENLKRIEATYKKRLVHF